MIRRTILIMMLSLFAAGCATTREPSQLSQLEIKVAQLERRVKDRDEEIEQLKYEIKDLNSQLDDIDSSQPAKEYYSASSSQKNMAVKAAPVKPSDMDGEIIRVSASAQDVQQALKSAGYYSGAIDGKVGAKTKEAITGFQQAHNLKADGIVGKRTWEELKLYLK